MLKDRTRPAHRSALAALMTIVVATIALYSFTFRVGPDELGVVLRFGEFIRQEAPGLHFRLPYPIDEVRLPKVMRQNIVEIGTPWGALTYAPHRSLHELPKENLVLTGDENIVAVNLVAFWRIKDAQKFLFKIQDPELTVQEVAESAMREVIGKSTLQPLLTEARDKTEQAVQGLMHAVLESYDAGIEVTRVRFQQIDPPAFVIDAFRDVQAARTDKERLVNEGMAYANRVLPEARGETERILQAANGYREQAVAEAVGQTARMGSIYEEYKKAPDVTRKRIYLETLERLLSGTDKTILQQSWTTQSAQPRKPQEPK